MNMSTTNQSFDAVILSIQDEARPKSNGKFFHLCEVQFTSGSLSGKKYFAQRTLGEGKAAITVGQNVKAILSVVKDDQGKDRPFFEISTSRVDAAEDIMAALGL